MNTTQKYIVVKDRVEIFKDFSISLLNYIFQYYIDKESLSDDVDIRNHFLWCYKKVCDEFLLEEIDFTDNNELIEYFYSYYYNQFYKPNIENSEANLEFFDKFWREIFEIHKQKNKNIFNIMVEAYKIFDKSIVKENIVEMR